MVANRRVTEDTAILGANVADGDLLDVVDISDSTDAATGTNKKITALESAVAMGLRLVSLGPLGYINPSTVSSHPLNNPDNRGPILTGTNTVPGSDIWVHFPKTAPNFGAGALGVFGVGSGTPVGSFGGFYITDQESELQLYRITNQGTGAFTSIGMECFDGQAFLEISEPNTVSGTAGLHAGVSTTRAWYEVTPVSGQTESLQTWYSAPGINALAVLPTGVMELTEQSTPAAAGSNVLRLYSQDVSGVSRLFLRDDVAARQIAVTTDIPSVPAFATNAIVLGSAAAAGVAGTVIRSDATIAAFDTTVPTTQAFGDAAAIGTAAFAARRDHKHAMPASEVSDTAYAGSWDGITTVAPSKNAVYDQLQLLAPLASPTLTGTPAAPTAAVGTSTTQIATTAYVQANDLLDSHIGPYPPTQYLSSTTGGTFGFEDTAYTKNYVYKLRFYSSGAINDAATWQFARAMQAGTWSMVFRGAKANSYGIGTIETSTDGASWTAGTTVDFYNSSAGVDAVITVTGISVPANTSWVRMRMASKNASSSNYYFLAYSFEWVRTA